jgi:hypothetical protein
MPAVRMFIPRLVCVAVAAMVCGGSAFAGDILDESSRSDDLSSLMQSPSLVIVCHGFGCRDRTEIAFSDADRARMAQILGAGKASPAAERQAIAVAVQWFDRRIGPEAGTVHHRARAGHENMTNVSAQFDCIDASRNTTTLLAVLEDLHLLKYHRVEETVARGALIDGRWPHATAVVTDRTTQKKWAVDSWTHAYGEKPDVKPLDIWLGEGGL